MPLRHAIDFSSQGRHQGCVLGRRRLFVLAWVPVGVPIGMARMLAFRPERVRIPPRVAVCRGSVRQNRNGWKDGADAHEGTSIAGGNDKAA